MRINIYGEFTSPCLLDSEYLYSESLFRLTNFVLQNVFQILIIPIMRNFVAEFSFWDPKWTKLILAEQNNSYNYYRVMNSWGTSYFGKKRPLPSSLTKTAPHPHTPEYQFFYLKIQNAQSSGQLIFIHLFAPPFTSTHNFWTFQVEPV